MKQGWDKPRNVKQPGQEFPVGEASEAESGCAPALGCVGLSRPAAAAFLSVGRLKTGTWFRQRWGLFFRE